jgi:hypothetical protein
MYEVEVRLSHLPGLSNDPSEYAITNDLGWVVSVQINRHLLTSVCT